MKSRSYIALFAISANAVLSPLSWSMIGSQAAQGTVTGFVTPSEVQEKEPFTFAAQGSVEGEVIEVKTVEGEVVATKKTDRLGRIFLAAGLAAGTYLLAQGGVGDKKGPTVPIEIRPQPPTPQPKLPLEIPSKPNLTNVKDGLKLNGTGINPNAAQMMLTNGGAELPVLASTARELKTGPLSGMTPGSYDFQVKNLETGQAVPCEGLTLYDAQSRLTRSRVANNEVTQLEFLLTPEYVRGMVKARVTSGPVHFGGGAQEKEVEVVGGTPRTIPILANATGMGKFTVAWELSSVMLAPPDQQEKKKPCPAEEHRLEPGAWQREQEGKKWVAWRRMLCQIHFGCSKNLGHAGAHDFTKKKRCTDREKFTDANGNGVWDENDGAWTDDGDKVPEAGEYGDANGDGAYNPPEKFEDKNKNGAYDGDKSEKKFFDTKDERDKFIKDNP